MLDTILNVSGKDIASPEAACNVQTLLPPLPFPTLSLPKLLRSSILSKPIVPVVVGIEVDTRGTENMARELAPCAKPLIGTSSRPLISHASLGAGEKANSSTPRSTGCPWWPAKGQDEAVPVCAFHAQPRAFWYPLQADAVRVIGCITTIAQEGQILMLCRVANDAGSRFLLFLGILVQPCEGVEFGHLFLVFDLVGIQKISCTDASVSTDFLKFGWEERTYLQSCRKPRQGEMLDGKWGSCLPCRSMLSNKYRAVCDRKLV